MKTLESKFAVRITGDPENKVIEQKVIDWFNANVEGFSVFDYDIDDGYFFNINLFWQDIDDGHPPFNIDTIYTASQFLEIIEGKKTTEFEFGEEIEVCHKDEPWQKRIFIFKNGIHTYCASVLIGKGCKDAENFEIVRWQYARKIPAPTKVKLAELIDFYEQQRGCKIILEE